MAAFLQGITSKVFVNAPPGTFYPGDPQFGPNGSAGRATLWKDFAPRAGIIWDPTGSGTTVIRAAYGIFYDQNTVELYSATGQGPPWGGRITLTSPPGGLADPFAGQPGGNPFPFVLNQILRSRNTAYTIPSINLRRYRMYSNGTLTSKGSWGGIGWYQRATWKRSNPFIWIQRIESCHLHGFGPLRDQRSCL